MPTPADQGGCQLAGGLRRKLAAGETVLGSWLTFAEPAVAEIMARAGFDWLTIDMEHSALTLSQAQELIRVIDLCGVPALVRLPGHDPALIKRVLDAGAAGIIAPMVNSAAEAAAVVAAAKYPPDGRRSVGLARAQRYGPGFEAYVAAAHETIVFVQIEHVDAVRDLDAILSVRGIDGLLVGPYDLTASMGIAGRFDDPAYAAALARIVTVARDKGIPAGLHSVPPDPAGVLQRVREGFQVVAYSVDFLFLGETCRQGVTHIRASIGSSRVPRG